MEPDRDRGTDRHTQMELDRDRGTDTHRDRQTETEGQTDRQTDTQTETERERVFAIFARSFGETSPRSRSLFFRFQLLVRHLHVQPENQGSKCFWSSSPSDSTLTRAGFLHQTLRHLLHRSHNEAGLAFQPTLQKTS